MSTITERVAAGAAFLDKREPGWWWRIDLDHLDLHSPCRCILGQLATDLQDDYGPDWSRILNRFGLRRWSRWDGPDPGDMRFSDAELGFNATGEQRSADYIPLAAEWKRVITSRREALPAVTS